MLRRLWIGGLLAVPVAGIALIEWRGDDSLRRVRAHGVLRIGFAVEPPYATVDAAGRVGGESPSVARVVAERLGLRPEFVLMDFDDLIPALRAGRIDLIAAGMFVTPQRARQVRFTRPTLRVRPGWLALSGRSGLPTALAEVVARDDLRVAVLQGSVELADLRGLGLPDARMVTVPDATSGRAAVLSGAADLLALSWPSVAAMAAASGGRLHALAARHPEAETSMVALALRSDDRGLGDAVDRVLAAHVGSPAHLADLAAVGLGADDLPLPERHAGG